MTEIQEELAEGYYFCPHCNRKTMHELQPVELPHYETASDEQIAELEANCSLFCLSCADREEATYREEVYGEEDGAIYRFALAASTAEKIANGEFEEDDDPYGYITPALDEDEEDDSGLSGELEEDDEGDGLPDPSDYEEDDHYVETFRDRRLDQ